MFILKIIKNIFKLSGVMRTYVMNVDFESWGMNSEELYIAMMFWAF